MRFLVNIIIIGVLLSLLSACSGGGVESTPADKKAAPSLPPVTDNNAPSVDIISPAAGAQASSNELLVSGTANDVDGVSSIVVNGRQASSYNGFADWSVLIALREGVNAITVSATDTLGNSNAQAATLQVERGYLFDAARSVVMDTSRQRAILIAENQATLMVVDSSDQIRREFSGPDVGSGPRFIQAEKLFLDSANNRVLVFDSGRSAVLAVGLDDADRTVLTSNDQGSGPSLDTTLAVAISPDNSQLYALTDTQLITVNLGSGNRGAVSLSGTPINNPRSARLDSVNKRLLVSADDTIYAVNINTGARAPAIATN